MLELAELPVLSHVRLLAHSHLEPNFWDPTISGNSEHFSFFLTTHYGVGGVVDQKTCDPFQIKFANVMYTNLVWISRFRKFLFFPGWVGGWWVGGGNQD